MFSGLVDAIGMIEHVEQTAAGRELGIKCRYEDMQAGESIAVNGVCLTVRECGRGWFSAAAAESTIQRTAIGRWGDGLHVNLERALRAGDRLGGHIVQGHVDGVGRVTETRDNGDALLISVSIPEQLQDLFVPLGSVAMDGVSLTVDGLPAADVLQVSVIDYTRRHTTLGSLQAETAVHLEADVIAKYVRQLVAPYLRRLIAGE